MEPVGNTFDTAEFSEELSGEPNRRVATRLLLENSDVRIWELRLEPGRRAPFHHHEHPYLWVCVQGGRARSRFPNGYLVEFDYEPGAANYTRPTAEEPEIHDLENVGTTTLLFTTVEILR